MTDYVKAGIKSIEDIIQMLKSRIVVLYGGVIAESTSADGICDQAYASNEWNKKGGMHNHAKIKELSFVLRSILHSDTIENGEIRSELDVIDGEMFAMTCTWFFGGGSLNCRLPK